MNEGRFRFKESPFKTAFKSKFISLSISLYFRFLLKPSPSILLFRMFMRYWYPLQTSRNFRTQFKSQTKESLLRADSTTLKSQFISFNFQYSAGITFCYVYAISYFKPHPEILPHPQSLSFALDNSFQFQLLGLYICSDIAPQNICHSDATLGGNSVQLVEEFSFFVEETIQMISPPLNFLHHPPDQLHSAAHFQGLRFRLCNKSTLTHCPNFVNALQFSLQQVRLDPIEVLTHCHHPTTSQQQHSRIHEIQSHFFPLSAKQWTLHFAQMRQNDGFHFTDIFELDVKLIDCVAELEYVEDNQIEEKSFDLFDYRGVIGLGLEEGSVRETVDSPVMEGIGDSGEQLLFIQVIGCHN